MNKISNGFLTFISFQVIAQQYKAEEFQAGLLEAKYGAMLVYNGQTNSFTLKFQAKSFKPADKPNFVIVDNLIIQSSIVPFTQKLDFNNLDIETQRKLLSGWKVYEKTWIEGQLKANLKDKEEFIEISKRLFLYWVTNMPKSKDPASVDNQVYLVTICFDQMLILSGPVEKGKTENLIRDKLVTIANTLELYPN